MGCFRDIQMNASYGYHTTVTIHGGLKILKLGEHIMLYSMDLDDTLWLFTIDLNNHNFDTYTGSESLITSTIFHSYVEYPRVIWMNTNNE